MRANFLRRLRSDVTGATLLEFALLAPVLISMMIGVLQVGVWVQAYNAVRNIVNDTTRFAMVEYQRGNKISDEAIENRALELAGSGKYNLDESLFLPKVSTKSTEVNGIKQRKLAISYRAPEFMPLLSTVAPNISYSRDLYLYDQSATVGTP
jgi:Flp pilus assembly pilin Flp